MITGLLGWFARKETNKREYPRRRKYYRASFLLEEGVEKPAIGVDVSGGGIGFLAQTKIPIPEFDMLMKLEDQVLRVRVAVVSEHPTTHDGRRAYRYGTKFTGIAADDWDAVVRYSSDRPVAETESAVTRELERVRMSPDDAARLLPLTLQNKLLAMLVRLRRLAPLDENQVPLVQFFYSGIVRQERLLLHHLTIQSKLVDPDGGANLFETEFLFDDAGGNVSIVAGGPVDAKAAAKG
jgi:hypothetical protein